MTWAAAPRLLCCGLCWMLVAALAASPVLAQSAAPGTAGAADCRFGLPAGWTMPDVRWSGACRDGWAQGRGSLRAYERAAVVRSFFGTLDHGQPVLGVIDQPDGFVAGRFAAGQLVQDGDRNTILRAFDDAAQAARQLADIYREAGNTASARFYTCKAEQLARQMD